MSEDGLDLRWKCYTQIGWMECVVLTYLALGFYIPHRLVLYGLKRSKYSAPRHKYVVPVHYIQQCWLQNGIWMKKNHLVSTFCEYIELLTECVQRYDASRPDGGHWMGPWLVELVGWQNSETCMLHTKTYHRFGRTEYSLAKVDVFIGMNLY
jgi:hypothetical protein